MVTRTLLLVNVALLVGLAAVGYRKRSQSSACVFALLQAVSAVWAALTFLGLGVEAGAFRQRIWGLATGLSLVVSVLWLAFILSYTGRDDLLGSRWFAFAAVPVVAGAVLYAAVPGWRALVGDVAQMTIPAGTVVQASIGPVGLALGVWIYAVFAAGLAVVVVTLVRGNELIVGQAVALFLGSLFTVAASVLSVAGIPVRGYPITEVALGGQSLLWGYATFRQEFLRVFPAVGRTGEHAVFDELDDGVLVVDTDDVVTRANPMAATSLGVDILVGRPLAAVVRDPDVSTPADLRGRFQHRGHTYQVSVSDVTSWRDATIGEALVLRDVTDLVRRQQRLQVLNRILRHNVRNDMTVVQGIGTQLEDAADDEYAELGAVVAEQAAGLMAVSEKALEIEKLFDTATAAERVDVAGFVRDVVDPLTREYPDASVDVDVDAGDVQLDADLLALVLEEAVENALAHSGDAPTVTVTAEHVDGRLEVCVADDGPGIPEAELEPIRSGRETDLEHASSLGLWLVYWGTQSLGGDVDVESTASGSTVGLLVPAATASATAPPPAA